MNRVKIAVLSDSHDSINNLKKAVEISNKSNCTHLFHLGDIVSPLSAELLGNFNREIFSVFGNCDGDKIRLNRVFSNFGGTISQPPLKLNISGKIFILMHEPLLIEEISSSGKTDYILYGHIHASRLYKSGKTTILNPGEVAGMINPASFYIIEPETNKTEKIDL